MTKNKNKNNDKISPLPHGAGATTTIALAYKVEPLLRAREKGPGPPSDVATQRRPLLLAKEGRGKREVMYQGAEIRDSQGEFKIPPAAKALSLAKPQRRGLEQ